jgi:VanZ family protein
MAYLCLANFKSLPKIGIGGADKYVHVTLYFVFTTLWSCHLKTRHSIGMVSLIKVVVISIIYGSLIEMAQGAFTTTREPDILDVLANTLGSLIAVVVILVALQFSSKKIKN